MRRRCQRCPREGQVGGGPPEEGTWCAGLAWHPRWLSCGPSDRTAKLSCPLSCLYSTWPQESLSPPDTNLEGVGWRDPNTLRADPRLSV